ncbi:MAG: hypothetical protein AAFY60_22495, partial [Myxococcota bacterium]
DEARKQLSTPFMGNRGFECTLQDFDGNGYDVVWATHALYAVPPDEPRRSRTPKDPTDHSAPVEYLNARDGCS